MFANALYELNGPHIFNEDKIIEVRDELRWLLPQNCLSAIQKIQFANEIFYEQITLCKGLGLSDLTLFHVAIYVLLVQI